MIPPQPTVDGQYPETSRATTALVLGILGCVLCWLVAPIAWVIGQGEIKAIDSGRRPPQNRSSARAGQVLGIVGTALLVVSAIVGGIALWLAGVERDESGEILEEGTIAVFDLQVGDCGDLPDLEEYLSVTVMPCGESHDFEVYAVAAFPDGDASPFPGESAAQGWADQECYAEFEGYVGETWEQSEALTYTYLYPSADSWDQGDREILCLLTHVNEGTPLVGSCRSQR